MADNLPISQGSGATVATDQVGGAHFQLIKLVDATADSSNRAVVDAGGSLQVALKGNVTIDSLPNVTVGSALPAGNNNIGNVDVVSNTAWSDPNTFIGLVTVGNTVNTTFAGNVTIDSGTITSITNDVNIADGGNSITVDWLSGATVSVANTSRSITGNVTIDSIANDVNIADGGNSITVDWLSGATVSVANTSRSLVGNVTIDSGSISILGNVTVDQVDVVTAVTDITNPVALKGNLTIDSGTVSIDGNVTVQGLNKTFLTQSFAFNTTNLSGATVFVGTASQRYNITNIILSANATVGVNLMSGVTYLTGNASIRMKLNAGGGFVENGTVLSPVYKGLADQQSFSIVLDEASPISGKVTYFEE